MFPSSSYSSSVNLRLTRLGILTTANGFSPSQLRNDISFRYCFSNNLKKLYGSRCQFKHQTRRSSLCIRAMDEDSMDMGFDDWDSDGIVGDSAFIMSSSGDDSDTDLYNPVGGTELSSSNDHDDISSSPPNILLRRNRRKTYRIHRGVIINAGLMAFSVVFLLLVDCYSWRIVRLPLAPYYLTRPFLISAVAASCAGYLCVPLFSSLKLHQILRKEGPATHSHKKGTPTMGGLFFIPIGITTAIAIVGSSSVEVLGAAVATLAFGAIGLLDDLFSSIKNHNYGLPAWVKLLLEAAVGLWFSYWLDSTSISSPYSMKMLVPLPSPLGLICLGKLYQVLTSFCFVSMGNGVNLTDGLDGLAGGSAALAFMGMSIAVLPISPDLAIFGASMAGSCIGFLVHNRYRASIFMGDTGSLALGGGLAAMAACTGMFFPLFISSGVFVIEALSVIVQVSYLKSTRWLYRGAGRRIFRMAPFHHHLELCGFKEPLIVASTYLISSILCIFAGYIGLISA
ncbi:phospho-N-acetylmuramoyl-pentapeptide-transferase homolog [Papaver somniferum]|nr:phospho-N-acetylmuramoyl-pentapeptide-transferase homolog [Papaver somniferum]